MEAEVITSTDQEQDAVDILAAVIREAHLQADMVAAFLEAVGFLPPASKRKGKTFYLPPDLLLKLGALMKLYQLACSGVRNQLPECLPSWEAVYEDVIAEACGNEYHFSGQQLATELMKVSLQRLCWPSLDNCAAIEVSQTLKSEALLDEIAELLWAYRHLSSHATKADAD